MVVLGRWLDLMILEVFSNLDDSVQISEYCMASRCKCLDSLLLTECKNL